MGKSVFIAEKPSVAAEFAKALKMKASRRDGYIEDERYIVTWCVGHLVTMSYPEVYDPALKKWRENTLPFLPSQWKYEIIPNVKKQFNLISEILSRADVETIYVCTDSGREGEYIYRLVEMMAGVKDKERKRVWIDSQTEEEILRGIQQAKPLAEYDNLSESAYLRAKEDYLMGINFSRILTLKFGPTISRATGSKFTVISVGRVMTCVLGMVVQREREIREFVKTPFYRVLADLNVEGSGLEAEWKAVEGSRYYGTPALYKENGFKDRETAEQMVNELKVPAPIEAKVVSVQRKKEKKNPPLLYNLAELQNDCSKMFKLSPDQTLKIAQELYEKKLITYPRTDARVLTKAVAKEIEHNIRGLHRIPAIAEAVEEILANNTYQEIHKTKYVNDKLVTDHYAMIPTGQGLGALKALSATSSKVYSVIVRRFLSIFFPPAVYQKVSLEVQIHDEHFFASVRMLLEEGYLKIARMPKAAGSKPVDEQQDGVDTVNEDNQRDSDKVLLSKLQHLRKGSVIPVQNVFMKAGETSPPKRYNSGSIILAMENAGQLIEDEDLRAQIKGSGIGTSATRAEILNKLVKNQYIHLNQKTQIITPSQLGEMIYDVVAYSIRGLLNPEMTASWEKGLTYIIEGKISTEEYMKKLEGFVRSKTEGVKNIRSQAELQKRFAQIHQIYAKTKKT